MVSSTFRMLYLRGNSRRKPLDGTVGGSHNGLTLHKTERFLVLPRIETRSFVAMKNELWGISTAWRRLCIHFITANGGHFHKTPEHSATWVQKEGLLRIPSLNYSVLQLVYRSDSISVFFQSTSIHAPPQTAHIHCHHTAYNTSY